MKSLALICCLLYIFTSQQASTQNAVTDCKNKVDVVILIDSSGTISEAEFRRMLRFVENFIILLSAVNEKATQISVIIYGAETSAKIVVPFNKYTDKTTLRRAVRRLINKQLPPNQPTYTFYTLANLLPKAYTVENGARTGVARAAVLLTDGRSTDSKPQINNKPAGLAAIQHTGATMFSVGIGDNIGKTELLEIAGSEDRVFYASGYYDLAEKAANISPEVDCNKPTTTLPTITTPILPTTPPPTTPPRTTSRTTTLPAQTTNAPDCDSKVDVVIIVDSSGTISDREFRQMIIFMVKFIRLLSAVNDKATQVSVIIFGKVTSSKIVLPFKGYNTDKTTLRRAVRKLVKQLPPKEPTYTFYTLAKLLPKAYTVENGARTGVARAAVLLTDGRSTDGGSTPPLDNKAEGLRGIKKTGATMYSVGIGDNIGKTELLEIAGSKDRVFNASGYKDLTNKALNISHEIECNRPTTTTPPPPPTTAPEGGCQPVRECYVFNGVSAPRDAKTTNCPPDQTSCYWIIRYIRGRRDVTRSCGRPNVCQKHHGEWAHCVECTCDACNADLPDCEK